VELLRRSAATATLVIERYRQPEPEGPQLEDLEDLLRTSVRLFVPLNMGHFSLDLKRSILNASLRNMIRYTMKFIVTNS